MISGSKKIPREKFTINLMKCNPKSTVENRTMDDRRKILTI